jgi:hypothetical protein
LQVAFAQTACFFLFGGKAFDIGDADEVVFQNLTEEAGGLGDARIALGGARPEEAC